MRIVFITLFPDSLLAGLRRGVVGRAESRGLVRFEAVNPRDYTYDRHHAVDDRPFSGAPGMLMRPEPVANAIEGAKLASGTPIFAPDPAGPVFDGRMANDWAARKEICFLCGHYEGIDQRVYDEFGVQPVSLGSFILSGGDVAATVMADAVIRLLPGVLGQPESLAADSFSGSPLLSAPNFTRPAVWRGRSVPSELVSGDPREVVRWQERESLRRTAAMRPDLLRDEDGERLRELGGDVP